MSVQTASRETRADRRRHQVQTGTQARRWGQPWTDQDDRYLVDGPGTVADRAAHLGRTYYAATYRLHQLRKVNK